MVGVALVLRAMTGGATVSDAIAAAKESKEKVQT